MAGGATGNLLKSWTPCIVAHVESLGFIQEFLIRFNVNSHCGSIRFHSGIRKSGSHIAKPLKRWFLNVHMDILVALLLCIFGGASS